MHTYAAADAPAYLGMIATLRGLLDDVARARPDETVAAQAARELASLRDRFAALAAPEADGVFGRVRGAFGRGQVMVPAYDVIEQNATSVRVSVFFGRYFLGNGAAHGGAVAMVFDEVLGLLANPAGGVMARTARLTINYRSITPIERPLDLFARVTQAEGRKCVVHGELRDGETLCADAEGLFVTLRPGQP